MGKICIIGAFRLKSKPRGGQEIKTALLADELERAYTTVKRVDTVGKLNHLLLPLQLLFAIIFYRNIIILPAHNGLIYESQILRWLNILFHRRLFYVVIGGWLQDYLPKHKHTAKALHHFYGIYVETSTMKKALEQLGYSNVYLFPNFKRYNLIDLSQIKISVAKPLKLCTFSRVSEMKGIGTAVRVVNKINKENGTPIFTLDIYGPMEDCDIPWLENLKKEFTPQISYKGVAPFDKSTQILADYFALLFPTKFFTEGIPGTLMDAYAAAVPVISSKWKSFEDVVSDQITGYGYEFDNEEALEKLLNEISNNPEMISSLKANCIIKAKEYLPENVLPILKFK